MFFPWQSEDLFTNSWESEQQQALFAVNVYLKNENSALVRRLKIVLTAAHYTL